jgi:hypothetical protein
MATFLSHEQRVEFSDAFIEASDSLATSFPQVTRAEIYDVLGQVRADCENHLPDLEAYREALIKEATIRLHTAGFESTP